MIQQIEAFDWQHGTFLAATTSSETTAAAAGAIGRLRRDPMAMIPFCGYNMGDYFAHWLKIGARARVSALPRIYYVNWFRQDDTGKFLWPGYGENSRVLKWIFERCDGTAHAVDTPIGRLPVPSGIDTHGLKISADAFTTLLNVDLNGWLAEVPFIREHFGRFGERLPRALRDQVNSLEIRLRANVSCDTAANDDESRRPAKRAA